MLKTGIGALICIAAASALAASAQTPAPAKRELTAAEYPKPAEYPKENKAAVAAALSHARKVAGEDLFGDFAHRCVFSPLYRVRVSGIQYDGWVPATKIFDNVYSVGQNSVSATAITTSAGIVLIDTLNNEDEAKNIIVPNMKSLGLDPAQIKYIILTHAHGDHFGGAPYLQKLTGAKVVSSKIDWDAMEKIRAAGTARVLPPPRDMIVEDGQTLTVGDNQFTFYVTPGHTDGVVSILFKVRDKGQVHTAGLFGGTGGARNEIAPVKTQIASLERWKGISQKAGVDVLIANHPLHDRATENNELIRYLPNEPNPYVFGKERYQRYVALQQDCARVQLGRLGGTE